MTKKDLSPAANEFRDFVASPLRLNSEIEIFSQRIDTIFSEALKPNNNVQPHVLLQRAERKALKQLESLQHHFVKIVDRKSDALDAAVSLVNDGYRIHVDLNDPSQAACADPWKFQHASREETYLLNLSVQHHIRLILRGLAARLDGVTEYGHIDFELAQRHGISPSSLNITSGQIKDSLKVVINMCNDYPRAFGGLLTRANSVKLELAAGSNFPSR